MTEESLPRGHAVLTPLGRREPRVQDAGRAWASLSALGVCIAFWIIIALFML